MYLMEIYLMKLKLMKTITNQRKPKELLMIITKNKGDKDKNLSLKEYLDMIRSYLSESLLQYYQKELEESK